MMKRLLVLAVFLLPSLALAQGYNKGYPDKGYRNTVGYVTAEAAAAPLPTEDLIHHYDGQDVSTVTMDGAYADEWADKVGSLDWLNIGVTDRPSYDDAIDLINGHRALGFHGGAVYQQSTAGGYYGNSSYTIVMVFDDQITAAQNHRLLIEKANFSTRFVFHAQQNNLTSYYLQDSTWLPNAWGTSAQTDGYHSLINSFDHDTNTMNVWLDGIQIVTNDTGNNDIGVGTGSRYLGYGDTGTYFNGLIGELVVFSTPSDAAKIAAIELYLDRWEPVVASNAIEYDMDQNGDNPVVVVKVQPTSDLGITEITLDSKTSVPHLFDQTHSQPQARGVNNMHEVVFNPELTLWDTDTLLAEVTFSDASTTEITQVIDWTPASVTVNNDGYLAGGYMQQLIKMLAPGAYGYSLDSQVETWAEFAEDFDTYIMGTEVISEIDDLSTNFLIDKVLNTNPDFVPEVYVYYGFRGESGAFADQSFKKAVRDSFYGAPYEMFYANGDTAIAGWGAHLLNPLGFKVVDGDTLWFFDQYAELVAGFVSHSTNYVANLGLVFDYARDYQYPPFDGLPVEDFDLDNDGIGYGTDTSFNPGGVAIWGTMTPDEAYQISTRRFITKMHELLPDVRISFNGRFGWRDTEDDDSWDWQEARLLEIPRSISTSTGVASHNYVETWYDFVDLVTLFADSLQENSGLGFSPMHWDFRLGSTVEGTDPERKEPIMKNMGEPAALLSGGITSFSMLESEAMPQRYAVALDETVLTIASIGSPTGEVEIIGWGEMQREFENGSVYLRWAGEYATPAPWGWLIKDSEENTIRTRNLERILTIATAPQIRVGFHNPGLPPENYDYNDPDWLHFMSASRNYNFISAPNANTSYDTATYMALYGSLNWPSDSGRKGLLYLGLDEFLDGQPIALAMLHMEVTDAGFSLGVGDRIYICAMTSSGMSWKDSQTTTWNNREPEKAWSPEPDDWDLSDFATYAYVAGPVSYNIGDDVVFVITDLVQEASTNPDTWEGFCFILYQAEDGSKSLATPNYGGSTVDCYIDIVTN